MSDGPKVVTLWGENPFTQKGEPCQQTIVILEALLEKARDGNISSVAVAYVTEHSIIGTSTHIEQQDAWAGLAAIRALLRDYENARFGGA